MNEEKLAIETLKALGVKDVTTSRQENNGTTCFELPTGDTIAEFNSGYIRKYLMSEQAKYKYHTCYQLNPVYQAPYKVISRSGKAYEWTHNKRMLIMNRAERLKRLVLYTIKQINKLNG
jgi:hypothetical protein